MFSGLTKELCIEFYKKMLLIRKFEEKVVEMVNINEIRGTTHEYMGEEAVAVGVCSALEPKDIITSTHRGHGHIIAKGGDVKYMMAELYGRIEGYNCGKGGSMHIADPNIGIFGANGIVGAGVPIAVGGALASKLRKTGQVAVAFYGDGGANQGVVHESMNMAAIWKLPVIFVCENNQYAVSTPFTYSSAIKKLSERAKAYGFAGFTIDGQDVKVVYEATKKAVEKARSSKGPTLLEFVTYRYAGHFTAEPVFGLNYRTQDEIDFWKSSKDPIAIWSKRLYEEGVWTQEEASKVDQCVEKKISEAVEFARGGHWPKPEDALKDMYATEHNNIPSKGWF